MRPARLVVRARQSAATEGLLSHHGARRLVVHVEVSCRHLQTVRCLREEVAVKDFKMRHWMWNVTRSRLTHLARK